MRYHNSILETIGNTPLVRLPKIAKDAKGLFLAKLEMFNPGGSVKDRIGQAMVEDAERRGLLRPGGTIIEPTSGNTGMGLAMVAAIKGYRTVFTIPDKMSREKIDILKAFGARVVVTPTAVPPGHPDSYYKTAERLHQEIPDSFVPNQYENPQNPEAHYRTTGPEIWRDTDGRVTHFVCGQGTGGTISGAGRFLKEKNPKVRVIGADPVGSVLKEYFDTKRLAKGHPYKIEGIGEDFIPKTTWFDVIDEIVKVDDREAYGMARRLAREEGILAGSSSGAALAVALKVAEGLGPDDVLVVLLPDTGARYLSKAHNEAWLTEAGFLEEPSAPLLQILRRKDPGLAGVVSVEPTATVREAVERMRGHGISQMPVLDGGRPVGSVVEGELMQRLLEDPSVSGAPVERVMAVPFPVVDPGTDLERVYRLFLRGSAAVLVGTGDRLEGIVTRTDVLEYLSQRSGR